MASAMAEPIRWLGLAGGERDQGESGSRLLRDRDWAALSLDALLENRVIGEPAGTGTDPAEAAEVPAPTPRCNAKSHANRNAALR
jgi:hypothetical protein